MAGDIHPREMPRTTTSEAEVAVYRALQKQLPDGWTAWHSLRLRTRSGWEGEGDFVIAAPQLGLLVLEVKGGNLELRDGRWLQNSRPMSRGPRDQAQGFVRNLVAELRRRNAAPPNFGVACAFPDIDFSEGPGNGDLEGLVVGRRDLPWLGAVLPKLVERAIGHRPLPGGDRPLPAGSPKWIECLHAMWGETWIPCVQPADRVDDAARRMLALNQQQLVMLAVAGDTRRALIDGGAGTGKTMLARELCLRRARRGERALFLCFTDALARVVERSFAAESGLAVRPRAISIRQYACELLERSGQVASKAGPDFWKEVSLQAACDAIPGGDERPDLVVVDEGQDLEEADWVLVECLAAERALWIFRDRRQGFWADRTLPARQSEGAATLRLLSQQRNPEDIAALAARYAVEDGFTCEAEPAYGTVPERPDPAVLKVVTAPREQVLERVREELDQLRKDGVRPGDIAVLSLAGQTRSALRTLAKLGDHALVRADSPDSETHTVADTFLRFKGLERPFIVITELARSQGERYETRMHIALTRATVGVTIVCEPEAAAADQRLVPLL